MSDTLDWTPCTRRASRHFPPRPAGNGARHMRGRHVKARLSSGWVASVHGCRPTNGRARIATATARSSRVATGARRVCSRPRIETRVSAAGATRSHPCPRDRVPTRGQRQSAHVPPNLRGDDRRSTAADLIRRNVLRRRRESLRSMLTHDGAHRSRRALVRRTAE